MIKKRFVAGAMSAILIAAGAVIGIAAPASAHTGDLNASATCQEDGTYKVTYTLTISQTNLVGATYWRTGTTSFESTPSSNAGMTDGPVASNGSGDYVLGSIILPGTSTQAPWAYAFTTWSDTFKKGSDGGDIALGGDCSLPAKADYGYTPATCETGQTLVLGDVTNATWAPETLALNGSVGPADFFIYAHKAANAQWIKGQDGTYQVHLTGPDLYLCDHEPEYKQEVTEGEPNCLDNTVEVTTTFFERTYSWNGEMWVPGEWVQTDVDVENRVLTPDEIAEYCAIDDIPAATFTDQCGVGGYSATLSTPTTTEWAWSAPVIADGKYTVTAVPAGLYHFADGVKTVFTFPIDDSACPLQLPTLAYTGSNGTPLLPIGLAGMVILLGAGAVILATRRA